MIKRAWVFLLVLLPAPVWSQEALLLGFRIPETTREALPGRTGRDSLAISTYRTLLVYAEAGGRYRVQGGGGLLLASGRGFVQVGTKRSRYNRWGEDFVWAAPFGVVPEYTGIPVFNGEYCTGYRTNDILFAGGRWVAVETRTAGYCEGSASPWDFNTIGVLPLDSLSIDGLDIAALLGPEGNESLARAAEAALDRMPSRRREAFIPEPDPANWAITRRRGRWAIVGRLETVELVSATVPVDFELDLAPPRALVGPQGAIPWDAVQLAARDARDAFAAPGGGLVAILRPNLLTIHPVTRGRVDSAILGHPLSGGATAVVVQWLDATSAQAALRILRSGSRR